MYCKIRKNKLYSYPRNKTAGDYISDFTKRLKPTKVNYSIELYTLYNSVCTSLAGSEIA